MKIYILFISLFLSSTLFSQGEYKCYSCEQEDGSYFEIYTLQDSVFIRDTIRDTIYISNINDITSQLNMSFDEFVDNFLGYVKSKQSSKLSNDETIYISQLRAMMNAHLKKDRYVFREYSLNFANDSFNINVKKMPLADNMPDSLNLDFLFVLEGEKNTNNFLNSPKQQAKVLFRILNDIKNYSQNNKNVVGINFYFPDFSFKEKRGMSQFVKSVSLVIDSSKIVGVRGLPLYFTFDHSAEANQTNYNYLVSLCDMVDSIFLAKVDNTPILKISFKSIDAAVGKANMPWLQQIRNQFYLARFQSGYFPITSSVNLKLNDIEMLMAADYPDSYWENYFYTILSIIVVLLIGTVCYFMFPGFTNFVHDNSMFVFAGTILLVMEVFLLFTFMIETMSNTVVFDFQNNQTMLFMPLVLIFVIPLFKNLTKKQVIP